MKKYVLAAAALVLMATNAQAERTTLYPGKFWSTWYTPQNDDGDQMCGMTAHFHKAGAANGAIMVKFTVGYGVFMQVHKSNWLMPAGTDVPMEVTLVDDAKPDYPLSISTDNAQAYKNPGRWTYVEMDIKRGEVPTFLRMFGDAEKLTVSFPEGDEVPWTANMDGSRMAAKWFAACRLKVSKARPPQRSREADDAADRQGPGQR